MITIGIDIGTTTISGAVLELPSESAASKTGTGSADSVARLLHAENIPNDNFLPPDIPDARIQDAEKIRAPKGGEPVIVKVREGCY